MKKQRGGIMSVLLLILVFSVSAAAILFTYYTHNLQYTLTQRERIEAYYLVLSGIELGKNALFTEKVDPVSHNSYTILDNYIDNAKRSDLTDDLTDQLGLDRDAGYEVTIRIHPVDAEGNDYVSGDLWVEIFTQAAVPTSSTSLKRTVTQAGSVRILAASPGVITRQLESPL